MNDSQVAVRGDADSAAIATFRVRVRGAAGEDVLLVQAQETLLGALERQGRRSIDIGCRGGGCGVCKIRVIEGEVRCGPMSACRVSTVERQQGYSLACRTYPCSDLLIEPVAGPAGPAPR